MNLDDLVIREDLTLIEALQKLDKNAKGILFVVNSQQQLRGALTDGDVRRYILRHGSFEAPVQNVMNSTPKSLNKEKAYEAELLLHKYSLDAVPILNNSQHIVDVVFRDGELHLNADHPKIDIPVVVMAGGVGTRLYPYTKVIPKPLIPINDIPIVERIMDRFHKEGSEQFYLVVNYKKEMIKAYFNDINKDYRLDFVDEETFLGTGGGLRLLADTLDTTFILTNCDILVEADFSEVLHLHTSEKNAVTMLCSLKNYEIPYGSVEIDAGGSLASIVEKPSLPLLINTGCYVVEPSVLEHIREHEEIGFPEVVMRCKEAGERVGVFPISENSWLDMGQTEEMRRMSERLGSR